MGLRVAGFLSSKAGLAGDMLPCVGDCGEAVSSCSVSKDYVPGFLTGGVNRTVYITRASVGNGRQGWLLMSTFHCPSAPGVVIGSVADAVQSRVV